MIFLYDTFFNPLIRHFYFFHTANQTMTVQIYAHRFQCLFLTIFFMHLKSSMWNNFPSARNISFKISLMCTVKNNVFWVLCSIMIFILLSEKIVFPCVEFQINSYFSHYIRLLLFLSEVSCLLNCYSFVSYLYLLK